MRRQRSSVTRKSHLCITPFPKAPGNILLTSFSGLKGILNLFCMQSYFVSCIPFRFEMQEAGISLDNTMKNFSLVPYGLQGEKQTWLRPPNLGIEMASAANKPTAKNRTVHAQLLRKHYDQWHSGSQNKCSCLGFLQFTGQPNRRVRKPHIQ